MTRVTATARAIDADHLDAASRLPGGGPASRWSPRRWRRARGGGPARRSCSCWRPRCSSSRSAGETRASRRSDEPGLRGATTTLPEELDAVDAAALAWLLAEIERDAARGTHDRRGRGGDAVDDLWTRDEDIGGPDGPRGDGGWTGGGGAQGGDGWW